MKAGAFCNALAFANHLKPALKIGFFMCFFFARGICRV